MLAPFATILLITCVNSEFVYYWRDFTGSIPKDAFPAGKDSSGIRDIYIGQAYINDQGQFVGTITPNVPDVSFAGYGGPMTSHIAKILCVPSVEQLTWLPTGYSTFNVDMLGKSPVIGGYDHRDVNKGMQFIGRIKKDGNYKVGLIDGALEKQWFYYVEGKESKWSENFEVLVVAAPPQDEGFTY